MDVAIFPIINAENDLPFVVYSVGSQTKQPHFTREKGYYVHQLIFCTSGEGTLLEEGKTYHLKKDDYFYLKPNVPHEYYPTTENWGTDWVCFDGKNVDELLKKLNLYTTAGNISNNKHRIHIAFDKIYKALKSNFPMSGFIASGALYDLLIEMYIGKCSTPLDGINSQTNIAIKRVIEYIDGHYQEQITLEELSLLAEVTPQYLCKIFKKALSIRPFEYLTKKRIQEAKKLLVNRDMPIKDVGEAVGYNDKSYFCLMFKKYEMISPSEFRGSFKG